MNGVKEPIPGVRRYIAGKLKLNLALLHFMDGIPWQVGYEYHYKVMERGLGAFWGHESH